MSEEMLTSITELPEQNSNKDFWQIVALWRRRLFTKMDIYRLHATASLTFMGYSIYEIVRILSSILICKQLPYAEFSWVPPLLLLVNFVKDASAFRLALKHRQGIIRNLFATASIMSVMTTCAIYYYDPYFPLFLDAPMKAVAAVACPIFVITAGYVIQRALSIVELRRDKRAGDDSLVSKLASIGFTIVPLFVPLWFLMNTTFMMAAGGWDLREYFFYIFPHQTQATFSLAMMGVATGSVGPFAPTLRDRKLIGRKAEMAIVATPFACLCVAFVATCSIYDDGLAILSAFMNPLETVRLIRDSAGFSLT